MLLRVLSLVVLLLLLLDAAPYFSRLRPSCSSSVGDEEKVQKMDKAAAGCKKPTKRRVLCKQASAARMEYRVAVPLRNCASMGFTERMDIGADETLHERGGNQWCTC